MSDKHAVHQRIVARLRQQAEDVRRLTDGLSEEQLGKRVSAEKWGLRELVAHLERIQGVFEARVEAMLTQQRPAIASYEPEADPDFARLSARPAAEILAAFHAGRERLTRRLEALGPAEWHRSGQHPEYTDYDVHFSMEYMAHHEAHHIYQMFQRRAPFGKLPH